MDRDRDRQPKKQRSSSSNSKDSQLMEKFIWNKKRDNSTNEDDEHRDEQRREETLRELERIKKRKLEKELEKRRWEDEKSRQQREKDTEAHKDWEREEEAFLLKQAKLKSEIRIKEGRAKPIDILYKNINRDSSVPMDTAEPYKIFKGLSLEELVELRKDVIMYKQLDENTEFWKCLEYLSDHHLSKRSRPGQDDTDGVHHSVGDDVKKLFKSKNAQELTALQNQMKEKIESGTAPEYWEGLLKRSEVFKAKAKLKEIHDSLMNDHSIKKTTTFRSRDNSQTAVQVTDPMELRRIQLEKEAQRLRQQSLPENPDDKYYLPEEELLRREMDVPMEEGEEEFIDEFQLVNKVYPWAEKHSPRKPRYYNRVIKGIDWNKYNQTHYDMENLPPPIVKGYKFNIFFPDLIDKKKTPQYFVEGSGDPDFRCVRFSAGAPYEDIAFRIPNVDWEYSHKKGFKCTFERGTLHLWFEFRLLKYRR